MAREKSKAELMAENRLLKTHGRVDAWVAILTTLTKWGGFVLIARYAYLSVAALAGKETLADIGIQFLSDVRVSEALAWLLATSGVVYGYRQRKLRRDTVERQHGRIEELERRVDPKRSSSRLTPRGETRPEDRP